MIQQAARSFPFKYLVLLISRYHSLIFSIRMPKIKRTTLTNKQNLLVLKNKDRNPNYNATHVIVVVNVAQWVKTTFNLDINPTTVGRLLKQNDIKECENVSNTKRSRAVQYPDLEDNVPKW